jgi:GNAT superfamily N-acetyltransferase
MAFERLRADGYEISTDPGRLDLPVIRRFLAEEAYWSLGIPAETVDRSIENSLPFGVYAPDGGLAGFARVVTDRAAIAYLGDVFVLEPHRGRGIGKWLVAGVLEHPDLQSIRTFLLGTADAHSLYERFGFERQDGSQKWMVRARDPRKLYSD